MHEAASNTACTSPGPGLSQHDGSAVSIEHAAGTAGRSSGRGEDVRTNRNRGDTVRGQDTKGRGSAPEICITSLPAARSRTSGIHPPGSHHPSPFRTRTAAGMSVWGGAARAMPISSRRCRKAASCRPKSSMVSPSRPAALPSRMTPANTCFSVFGSNRTPLSRTAPTSVSEQPRAASHARAALSRCPDSPGSKEGVSPEELIEWVAGGYGSPCAADRSQLRPASHHRDTTRRGT